ncbi:FMN reductase [Acrocarpospora pleiomorpha]|uniref:FMN reductase n=1 Tax=Acrocarpospora pleiomorpha TaxID=90975 RepID=A0A5M3X8W2_9ACTN|nr:NAD(P)H-dependent oxidoreductase [Acrocarpospora pleiomorpha]GES17534.1 FMN reductase [Acrocarpospora pleiomorpha]
MSKLKIIVGTTRPTRNADRVTAWVQAAATSHGAFEVEVLDLRDWPLPFFAEHFGSVGDINDPTYSQPLVKAWNRAVKDADAYLVVTGEYNHSVPGVLKNAIDTVWLSHAFRNKPVAAVGYSAGIGGGIRSLEHLAQIMVETEAVPLRNTVVMPFITDAFDDTGQPTNPATSASLQVLLDDLAWWSTALERARAAGELVPGRMRLRDLTLKAQAAATRAS